MRFSSILRWAALPLALFSIVLPACGGDGTTGSGGAPATVCSPGEAKECFSGAPEQKGVGICVAGQSTCLEDGSGFGPCEGEVLPAQETCANHADEDCDGLVDEEGPDCVCAPGETKSCYTGPAGTKGVGACKAGKQTCNADGTGWGPCQGQVTPKSETCFTGVDDDCDGFVNESGAGCDCAPNAMVDCYPGPPGTMNVGSCKPGKALCNAQGTSIGPCMGAITPAAETCLSDVDDDCDGLTQETTNCACPMGDVIACYTGPANTENVGVCHGGEQTCLGGALGYGPCTGEVKPSAEVCATPEDEDCDGTPNDGCPCAPGEVGSCYTGPANTENVGVCHGGMRTCNPDGLAWGPCMGEVKPSAEVCSSGFDENCNGTVDEKTWVHTTLNTSAPGPHSSIVVDAAGGVHTLYHDTFFDDLVYAYKAPGGNFVKTTLNTSAPGPYQELVVDAAGGVHALYHDTFFNDLVYAYKAPGGNFVKTTLDNDTPGPHSALVIDASGGVHALYHDMFFDDLVYAYKAPGGVFVKTTISIDAPGPNPKLVVDAAGGVHTLYHDTFFNDLVYAYKAPAGMFVKTTVDNDAPGAHPKLEVDASGGVHALYRNTFFGDLNYAYKPPAGMFTLTIVDTSDPGDDPALVVDSAGGVHALYHDTFFNDLDYAYKPPGGSFSEVTVDTSQPEVASALIVDSAGGVHALYVDLFFNDLNYAYKPPGGSFSQVTVDTSDTGDDPRLVVDAQGGLHALHFDMFFNDLNYSYRCP